MTKRKSIRQKIYNFTAIFEPSKDGGFTATIPVLPGCISEGDSFEETMKNIKEAADLYLEVSHEAEYKPSRQKEENIIVAPIQIAVNC